VNGKTNQTMAINDLLPFATGAGANVIPQASYQGLPARQTGFQSGVAESSQVNKAWRQSAFTSAMIGQFTTHNSLEDVLDDGDVDNYERKFISALRAASTLRRGQLGGSATAATIAFTPPYPTYNQAFFLADVTILLEDGATLNVDTLGVRPLRRNDGTPIQKGDAPVGAVLFICDDGSGLRLLNVTPYLVQSGSTNYAPAVRVAGTANAIALTMVPPVLYYREGAVYRFMPIISNTGPTTVSLNGLAPKPLTEIDGHAFAGGEIIAGSLTWIQDAGANFVFLRFSSYLSDWSKPMPGLFYAYADPNPGYTTLANTVWTKVPTVIEQVDVQGWFDPATSRYTPQQAGYYYFTADCSFGSNPGASPPPPNQTSHGIRVFLNGTPSFYTAIGDVPGTNFAGSANGTRGVVSGITHMNGTNDFAEVYAFQDFLDTNGNRRAAKMRWGGWFLGR